MITAERVERRIQDYVDQCILEAIRTELPEIKQHIHEMVRSHLKNDEKVKALVAQFGMKADTEPVPVGTGFKIPFADGG